VSLTSLNNLVDQFTFSCPNLSSGITCTFSPASGVLQTYLPLTTVLTVHVNSKPSSSHRAGTSLRKMSWFTKTSWLFLGIIFAAGGLRRQKKSRTAPRSIRLAGGALLLLVGLAACGGGSSSTNPPPPPPPPPPTTVNIQVQATSPSVTKTFSFITVTVP
jgi:hypothetical protein